MFEERQPVVPDRRSAMEPATGEPHAAATLRTSAGTPAAGSPLDDPRALQILTTEHWSLLSSRALSWNEAFSRAGMFLSAVSGSVVALALAAQATTPGAFVTFALILLSVDVFLGCATIVRLAQTNNEDLVAVQGMNRLRHAYLEIAPDLAPYFVTKRHDDPSSIGSSYVIRGATHPFLHGLVTTPAIVSVITSVIAGVIAGLAAMQLSADDGIAVAAGVAVSLASFAACATYGGHEFHAFQRSIDVRFPPTPDA